MTNREIDRQIAELMGYEVFEVDGIECIETVYDFTGGEVFVELPAYSEDWNAMRLLVEWLQGKVNQISIYTYDGEWCVDIGATNCQFGAYADQVPLALCKAVLSFGRSVKE